MRLCCQNISIIEKTLIWTWFYCFKQPIQALMENSKTWPPYTLLDLTSLHVCTCCMLYSIYFAHEFNVCPFNHTTPVNNIWCIYDTYIHTKGVHLFIKDDLIRFWWHAKWFNDRHFQMIRFNMAWFQFERVWGNDFFVVVVHLHAFEKIVSTVAVPVPSKIYLSNNNLRHMSLYIQVEQFHSIDSHLWNQKTIFWFKLFFFCYTPNTFMHTVWCSLT